MRLEPVPVPDAAHRGGADPIALAIAGAVPMGCLMRRRLIGHSNDTVDGLGQGRDARGPGLVAGEPRDPLVHETLLPAPDYGFALAAGVTSTIIPLLPTSRTTGASGCRRYPLVFNN